MNYGIYRPLEFDTFKNRCQRPASPYVIHTRRASLGAPLAPQKKGPKLQKKGESPEEREMKWQNLVLVRLLRERERERQTESRFREGDASATDRRTDRRTRARTYGQVDMSKKSLLRRLSTQAQRPLWEMGMGCRARSSEWRGVLRKGNNNEDHSLITLLHVSQNQNSTLRKRKGGCCDRGCRTAP